MYGTTLNRASWLIFSILLIASHQGAAQAGHLDPTFGQGGIVTTDFGVHTASAAAVTIQTDGKIVVFGGITSPGSTVLTVVRYNSNGSLDTGFGRGGMATVSGLTFPSAVTLQPDGKIVAVGFNIGGFGVVAALPYCGFPPTAVSIPHSGAAG